MPFVKPVIVRVVEDASNVDGDSAQYPTYGVTTYPVSPGPPSDVGVSQFTVADWLPAVALRMIVGADGTVAIGVTGLVTVDVGPEPAAFSAETLNRYVVPFVSPKTVCVVAVELNVLEGFAMYPTYGVTT